jgi:hypothetical protein
MRKINAYNILAKNMEGLGHLGYIGINERIILKSLK